MKLTIENIDNGYLCTSENGAEEEAERQAFTNEGYDKTTFERFKAIGNEQVALGLLLEYVAETFGRPYDKFANNNVSITFDRKGSKAV